MFHINQSHMDVRRDGSRLDERLLSMCSVSKHQVFGGGIFGNIQRTPWIFLLFTLMFFSPSNYSCRFFLFFMMIRLYSYLLRAQIIVLIDWVFFPILILSIMPFHSVLNSYKLCLYSDSYNCNLYLKFLVHLLFAYCLPVHHSTITSIRIERLTVWLFYLQHIEKHVAHILR